MENFASSRLFSADPKWSSLEVFGFLTFFLQTFSFFPLWGQFFFKGYILNTECLVLIWKLPSVFLEGFFHVSGTQWNSKDMKVFPDLSVWKAHSSMKTLWGSFIFNRRTQLKWPVDHTYKSFEVIWGIYGKFFVMPKSPSLTLSSGQMCLLSSWRDHLPIKGLCGFFFSQTMIRFWEVHSIRWLPISERFWSSISGPWGMQVWFHLLK